jgi:chromosome segregation ATPase
MSPTEYQQLTEFLGQRFTEVDRRFTGIEGRFTGLETRVDDLRHEMLGHFDEIYRRLDRLEQEYQAITQALRRIEAGLADERRRRDIIERDLAELKRYVAALQARIEDIEQRLGN